MHSFFFFYVSTCILTQFEQLHLKKDKNLGVGIPFSPLSVFKNVVFTLTSTLWGDTNAKSEPQDSSCSAILLPCKNYSGI